MQAKEQQQISRETVYRQQVVLRGTVIHNQMCTHVSVKYVNYLCNSFYYELKRSCIWYLLIRCSDDDSVGQRLNCWACYIYSTVNYRTAIWNSTPRQFPFKHLSTFCLSSEVPTLVTPAPFISGRLRSCLKRSGNVVEVSGRDLSLRTFVAHHLTPPV